MSRSRPVLGAFCVTVTLAIAYTERPGPATFHGRFSRPKRRLGGQRVCDGDVPGLRGILLHAQSNRCSGFPRADFPKWKVEGPHRLIHLALGCLLDGKTGHPLSSKLPWAVQFRSHGAVCPRPTTGSPQTGPKSPVLRIDDLRHRPCRNAGKKCRISREKNLL